MLLELRKMRMSSQCCIMHCVVLFQIIVASNICLAVPSGTAQLLRELSGSHLLISAYTLPPVILVHKGENGTSTYSGHFTKIVDFMAEGLKTTYSYVNVREEEAKRIGNKESIILLLSRNEVNVSSFGMAMDIDHCSRMDCAVPFTAVPSGMIVPWPEDQTRLKAILQPFQSTVWIMVLISLTAVTLTLSFFARIYQNNRETTSFACGASYSSVSNAAVYVFNILTSRANIFIWDRLTLRILMGSWCLAVFVLLNAYSGTLLSAIIVPILEPVPKTLEDIAYGHPNNKLKLVTELNQILASLFLSATSGAYKLLGDSLREHPERMFTTHVRRIELLSSGKYVTVTPMLLYYSIVEELNKKAGSCKFTISNKRIPNLDSSLVFTFVKNWRYTKAVNERLQLWWDAGFVDYWNKKYRPNVERCVLNDISAVNIVRRISLKDLSGSFYILFILCSFAFLVFLMELFSKIKIKSCRKRNPV